MAFLTHAQEMLMLLMQGPRMENLRFSLWEQDVILRLKVIFAQTASLGAIPGAERKHQLGSIID